MIDKMELCRKAEKDLCLNQQFIKGQNAHVRNCWHFFTDGKAVDFIFKDKTDFLRGMNRIYVLQKQFDVLILAFVLMDTHVHFILYGSYEDCLKFIMEYIRLTSMYLSHKYDVRKKLLGLPVSHQHITDDRYLKSAICYVIKNPTVGGLPYNLYDYPWSSGSLYFRPSDSWTHSEDCFENSSLSGRDERRRLGSHKKADGVLRMSGSLVYPGEYVEVDLVQRLFRSTKGYLFFLAHAKDEEIESHGGEASSLSIPLQELRQYKAELCRSVFHVDSSRTLDTSKRLKLARMLKSRYNCSTPQIARVCGLKYQEVKNLI